MQTSMKDPCLRVCVEVAKTLLTLPLEILCACRARPFLFVHGLVHQLFGCDFIHALTEAFVDTILVFQWRDGDILAVLRSPLMQLSCSCLIVDILEPIEFTFLP